ncbi:MAG: hypothetical protein AAGM22_25270 [Acidobacteriota bacterium]
MKNALHRLTVLLFVLAPVGLSTAAPAPSHFGSGVGPGATGNIAEASVFCGNGSPQVADEVTRMAASFFFGSEGMILENRILLATLNPGDSGRTFRANRRNNPDFDSIVATLTDGIDDSYVRSCNLILDGMFVGGGSAIRLESSIFADVPGGNGIDLQGFDVTDVVLQVDSFTVDIQDPGPGASGGTETLLHGTLIFQSGDIFSDDFESGDLSMWSAVVQP